MILRNRNELKSVFKNDRFLSEIQFAELIDSMLNKRDDQFHGLWQSGQTYCPGDVVFYKGAFWEMSAADNICSQPDQPPSQENPNWKLLIVPVDDDWKERIEQELETLRQEFTLYQQQIEIRLQELSDRIEQCEEEECDEED